MRLHKLAVFQLHLVLMHFKFATPRPVVMLLAFTCRPLALEYADLELLGFRIDSLQVYTKQTKQT